MTDPASVDPMSAARPLPAPVDPRTMDHFVYLHVDWRGYQQLLAMRGESSVPRITYLEGLAELMSPSRYHEIDKTCFARLLETWSEIADVPLEGYGSWTLEDEEADRGAEADECYTVRRVAESDEDRPDIAVEVVWTSGGINKLEVYRKLGVREVWFYERGKLRFSNVCANPIRPPPYARCALSSRNPSLARQRIGSDLELHGLAERSLPSFRVPDQVRAVIGPEPTAFPTRRRIVDSAIEPAMIEAERVRHAQRRPVAGLGIEHQQCVGVRTRRDRRVRAEARDVVLVDPVVVVEVGRNVRALEARTVG